MRDPDLDSLFAALRAAEPRPDPDLIARIEADAAALQPRPRAVPDTVPRAVPRRAPALGWRRRLAEAVAALGGAPGLAGLAAAAAAGLWLGFLPPAPVAGLSDRVSEGLARDGSLADMALTPSFDDLLTEG